MSSSERARQTVDELNLARRDRDADRRVLVHLGRKEAAHAVRERRQEAQLARQPHTFAGEDETDAVDSVIPYLRGRPICETSVCGSESTDKTAR